MIKLVEKEHCSGCTACMACCPKEAISMCADEEGFKYPVIDRNRCVECGKCVRTCPITNKQKKNPVVASYIAINNNIGIFILSIVKIKGNTILSLVTGKFTGLFSEDSRSYMQRYGALIIALELILQKNSIFGFLFGNGLSSLVGNFVTNRRTITDLNFYVIDNQYITSWYDSGFVFLILCVFICVHFIIELTKIIGDKHIEISLRKKSLVLLIGMILVMFYSFIIDVLTWYQPIFIISFIIALSNWNIKEAKKECEYTR